LALAKSLIGLLEALDPEIRARSGLFPPRVRPAGSSSCSRASSFRKHRRKPSMDKDCLQSLGLLLESDVRKEFQKGSSTGLQERAVNLKELLLNMVETLRTQGDGEGGRGYRRN